MAEDEKLCLKDESGLTAKVQTLCQIYGGSAESVGSVDFSKHNEVGRLEVRRNEYGRSQALDIAIQLEDDLRRDTALQAVFELCMKAKDIEFATIVAEAITLEVVQRKIVQEFPHYFLIDRRDGKLHPTTAASLGYHLK